MYRALKTRNNDEAASTIHYLLNKYCSQFTCNYIWAVEDFMQTVLIMFSLLMKFDLLEIKLILIPNIFISIVIATVCFLKEIAGSRETNILIEIIICILTLPIGFIIVLILLCLAPCAFFRTYIHSYSIEQYSFPDTYKHQPLISKYLFEQKHKPNEITLKILAINYYLTAYCYAYFNDLINSDDSCIMEYVACKNLAGSSLDSVSFETIRNMSSNRKTYNLRFASMVNAFMSTYNLYFLFLVSYIWIYKLHVEQKKDWFIMVCLIIYYLLKCMTIVRGIRRMYVSYVMFHIVIPVLWINQMSRNDCISMEEIIENIDSIYQILYISSIQYNTLQLKSLTLKDMPMEIMYTIMQFAIYPLPIDGNIECIHNIINDFNHDQLDI